MTPQPVQAQHTFTVDATGDDSDFDTTDDVCDINDTAGDGPCTLRAAIEQANATTNSNGADRIEFDLAGSPPHTIQPTGALPSVTDPVLLRGQSEPDYDGSPVVVVDGARAGSGVDGLTVTRASAVQGLAIVNFDENGLVLENSTSHTIQDNYIGIAPGGTAAGNGGTGIQISNTTSSLIGPGNVISSNGRRGIFIGFSGSDDNTVYGNLIGTDPTGTAPMGNAFEGVLINDASHTVVGGTESVDAGSRNVISDNGRAGVAITGSNATDNTVNGNYIGVAADGATGLGNDGNGVEISRQASSNTIGATNIDGTGNVISGNDENGVLIQGTTTNPGTSLNVVAANRIGTDDAGTAAVPNSMDGVRIDFANDNFIGSTLAAANVISGNSGDGIDVTGENTEITGNVIGVDADESNTLGNGSWGVLLRTGSDGTTLGGTSSASANIVGGNAQEGLRISGSDNVTLQGSFIGISRTDTELGNGSAGVRIDSGSNNVTVGGTANGAENVISGNGDAGVVISDFNDIGTSGNEVLGNLIGTDTDGDDALPNSSHGVAIEDGASNNTIGGPPSGAPNTIAHNQELGIVITNGTTPADNNSVRANAVFDNSGLGMDLANDGQTTNDDGDSDVGPNRLQNVPVIQRAGYDAGNNDVTITYEVPSDPTASGSGASAYPITVDLYRADADDEEGQAYLGTDTYTASDYSNCSTPPCPVTHTLTPAASVTTSDDVVATATDADGNTSEFSAQAESLGPDVFVVDGTEDGADSTPGDGTCATAGGGCTLRAAIEETNAKPNNVSGPDEIHFAIAGMGPHTIQPGSELPDVNDPVVIDGSTEPDFSGDPVVVLDGVNLSANILNLETGSEGSSVLDLALINSENSIALFIRTDNNLVDGCWIGLAPDGTMTPSNSWGLRTFGSSNQIGDPSGRGNVVVGASTGIGLAGGASNNAVQNNRIGQTPDGTDAGNNSGIDLSGGFGSVTGNTIGGTGANEGNLIAHNTQGILLTDDAVENAIRGNRLFDNGGIGIDLSFDDQTPNDGDDSDDGPNRLQNFPVIQRAGYDASANEVTATYLVPSAPNASGSGASAYPLTVDLYKADADDEEGQAYLGTDTYTASDYSSCGTPPCPETHTLTPAASVTTSDDVVATATDANGNTSEFSGTSPQLPVALTTLTATASGQAVRLTWRTASETNNAGFEVQRQRPEGSSWTQVGFVEGHGTTSAPQRYAFNDADVPYEADSLAYRLKQIDTDGATTLSKAVEVALAAPEQLALHGTFPNPVRIQTTIRYEVPKATQVRLSVYDVLGRRVTTLVDRKQEAGRQSIQFDASPLASGVYFVRLSAEGATRTQKLTVVQ